MHQNEIKKIFILISRQKIKQMWNNKYHKTVHVTTFIFLHCNILLYVEDCETVPFIVPVQHECIPQAILGMDVICQAKSGMGKTAVFVLATLQQLEPVDGQVQRIK